MAVNKMTNVNINEIKKGKWLPCKSGDSKCSECGFEDDREPKFCPDCGARMSHFTFTEGTWTWKVVGE